MDTPYRIPLEAVQSTNLAAIGYDPAKRVLAVQFQNGSIYHYADVPFDTATDLYSHPSKGSFYSKNIRSKFPGQRMTGPCEKCGAEGFLGETCEDCGSGKHVEKRSLSAQPCGCDSGAKHKCHEHGGSQR